MSARYRVKEHRNLFTPERRVLGFWIRMARPQTTMEAASRIIRERLRHEHGGAIPKEAAHTDTQR